jgi:hypothetical protein
MKVFKDYDIYSDEKYYFILKPTKEKDIYQKIVIDEKDSLYSKLINQFNIIKKLNIIYSDNPL